MKPTEIIRKDASSDFPKQYLVVQYDEIRCTECKRMLYCHNWLSAGYPHTYCEACEIMHTWPFEDRPELELLYSSASYGNNWFSRFLELVRKELTDD